MSLLLLLGNGWVKKRYRGNKELLEASFYILPVPYQRKVGDSSSQNLFYVTFIAAL
jgi:hypothetical protein